MSVSHGLMLRSIAARTRLYSFHKLGRAAMRLEHGAAPILRDGRTRVGFLDVQLCMRPPQDEGGAKHVLATITSHLQRRDVDPAPFLPALEPGFGELHALGALDQRPFERGALIEVADEH